MKVRTLFAFAVIYVVWGSTYLAIRIAIETIPPFLMMGVRSLSAGLVLYAMGRFQSGERLTWNEWRWSLVLGALFFLGGHGALAWGELSIPSGVASLLVATIPVWIALAEVASGKALLTWRIVSGLALGLAGVGLLAEPGRLLPGESVDPLAAVVVVLGAMSWAFGTVLSRRAPSPKSWVLTSAGNLLAGGSLLVVASLLFEAAPSGVPSLRSGLALGYLVVFGSVLGFGAYVWLLRIVPAWKVGTYAFVNPGIAVLIGFLAGGEPLSLRVGLATALMAGGVALLVLERRTS
jgi:drug/metabolite transporter (DMT)-like permease